MSDQIVELYEDAVIDGIESVEAVRADHFATVQAYKVLKRVSSVLAGFAVFISGAAFVILLSGVKPESFGFFVTLSFFGLFGFMVMVGFWLVSVRGISHSMEKVHAIEDIYGAEIEMVKTLRILENSTTELSFNNVDGSDSQIF